jgi:hypothetical protein
MCFAGWWSQRLECHNQNNFMQTTLFIYLPIQSIKGMEIAGQTNFPPAPHTFEEVVAE